MFCVGLTGGIGCGKSQAADLFAALGAAIIDTDVISHELTRPGGAAMASIEQAFGRDYVRPDASLDRASMRKLVFGDANAKRRLEAILHPLIRAASRSRIAAASAPYAIVVVPLLLETGAYRDLLNRVLVVDCNEEQQVARTMARSALADDEVRRIMKAQLPRATRLQQADDVLRNDGDIEALGAQVATLHQKYLEAARSAG